MNEMPEINGQYLHCGETVTVSQVKAADPIRHSAATITKPDGAVLEVEVGKLWPLRKQRTARAYIPKHPLRAMQAPLSDNELAAVEAQANAFGMPLEEFVREVLLLSVRQSGVALEQAAETSPWKS